MREQFNLENFLAGKYERFETRDGKKVDDLAYLPSGYWYNLAGVTYGDLFTWTKEGNYYYGDESNSLDLFGILKP